MKTMRLLFTLLLLTAVTPAMAQNTFPVKTPGAYPNAAVSHSVMKDSVAAKKWFVSKYTGISTSFSFFNGGNAMLVSVPLGLQLNRRLSTNWTAFAGIAAAPTYVNFNNSFLHTNISKTGISSSPFNNSRFDINTRAEIGLMYSNDQKTFSISGSISVERSSYPWLSPALGTGIRPVAVRPVY